MRWKHWVLLLFCSAQFLYPQTGLAATDKPTAGRASHKQSKSRAKVCFIIEEQPSALPKRVARILERSFARSPAFAPVTRIAFTRTGKPTTPSPGKILKRALRHDIIICFGTLPTRIALLKKKIPKRIRVYTVCSLGTAHVISRSKIFKGLDRLRGGVALDVPLATAIDFSEKMFKSPGPYGTIVTPTVPQAIIDAGVAHAEQLGVKLIVQTATGATIERAALQLKKQGIKTFIKLPDPLGVYASNSSIRSAMANVEILFKRNKIAIMGIGPGDVSAAYCFLPSAVIQAKILFEMIEQDRRAPMRPRPGIVCTQAFVPNLLPRFARTHLTAKSPLPTELTRE